MVSEKKIVVLGTGGTIAGRAASAGDYVGYTAGQVGIEQLLQAVPPLADAHLLAEQVAQLDSKDMDYVTWARLAERCAHWLAQPDIQGLVITHGTDTVEETAYFLHSVLRLEKPVVLTCAMRPASALAPDGPQNIWDAVTFAREPGWAGAALVCAGLAHSAVDVQKSHTYSLDAFSSGDAAALARIEQARVRWLRPGVQDAEEKNQFRRNGWAQAAIKKIASGEAWPRVELIVSHAGAGPALVDALLAQQHTAPLRGLVVAGTGSGTVHHELEAALARAQARGVIVWRSTRCASGRTFAKQGEAFDHAPATLTAVKARLALVLGLLAGVLESKA